ncbi:uncharacterized protein rab44 isoform X2 [Toxotes jaculatrix]|uniref:uncharacterized protein rab44 isoform X2 n=1 Tax=Toxotes jaculatrix TaxID=941984 RepID=UPI001B3A7E85|nr:uncharacterized protein rab44 isoform X2 [Toxotes jaculatrix]
MSDQRTKKKRLGSRRWVANQNETSKGDEFHVTDSTSLAERHIPEENNESFSVMSNPDSLQSETQHPPSLDLTSNKRKLGSRRKNKERQYVEDSATESYHETREEAEENTRRNETLETTQISLAIQSDMQQDLSQVSEHDTSATHGSSLYSTITPGYSFEVQNPTTTKCSEDHLEGLLPKSGNQQADHGEKETGREVMSDSCKLEETMLQVADISDTPQSEEVKENAHLVGSSNVTSLTNTDFNSRRKLGSSRRDKGRQHVKDSVAESYHETKEEVVEYIRGNEAFDTAGISELNSLPPSASVDQQLINHSKVKEMPEKSSLELHTQPECSAEREMDSSPKEELSANEEQNEHFNVSEVRGTQHSEDTAKEVHEEEEVTPTEMQEIRSIDYSSESVIHDAKENSEISFANPTDQAEVSDTYQSELSVESIDSATKQEVSNPDDEQDEHPMKESNVEALDQRNEDYGTKTPQTSDTEIADTALGQVYENEGRGEDDVKPAAEQTSHQEKEGLLSEMEHSKYFLQTLQSESNASLDSQLQDNSVKTDEQNEADFNPLRNRRKLGSSRRNKGRQHVKDSGAESHHKPTEEDVEDISSNETLETATSSTLQTTVQEELSQENDHDVIMSVTYDTSLYTASTPDYSSEVHNPTTTNYPEADLESPALAQVYENEGRGEDDLKLTAEQTSHPEKEGLLSEMEEYSVTGTEKKEKEEDTDVLRQWGILQANNLMSESHVKSDDVEPYMTPEISTEKRSLELHTEPECSAEREMDSSPKEELSANEEQNEPFNVSEVRGTQHSEDTAKEVHEEEEVTQTEMQEIHSIDYSSESVIHDAKENSEISFANPTDQAEVSDTYQPELSVESIDSATKQEVSNPDDEQDEHPMKESNVEALDQRNEDYGTKTPQTSDTEIADTALGQVYENEGRGEDDVKPAAEQTSHQEKEGLLSEMEDSKYFLQTPQSETNAPLDSQLQDNSVKTDEQNDSDFNPLRNKRKLGSSRRNKGRQHVKDSGAESHHKPTEEDVEDISSNETLETAMSSTLQTTVQEELSQENDHDVIMSVTYDTSLYTASTPDYSSEVHNPTTTNYPEADLESDDTKIPQTSDTERADTALAQVYENEGRGEDDLKLTAEQTSHPEKEGLLSEMEEYSVTGTEKKERDEDTDVLRQWGILQANNLMSESHVKSDDVEPYMTTELSTEKSSLELHTEPECSAEREMDSSPKEELSANEEQNEPFNVSEVRGTQHSEDTAKEVHEEEGVTQTEMQEIHSIDYSSASLQNLQENHHERETEFKVDVSDKLEEATLEGMNKSDTPQSEEVSGTHYSKDAVYEVQEQEANPTQIQKMHESDFSLESVIHDAKENSEIRFANPTDQAEVSDTYQPELSVESIDSATKQEVSNPDDEQDEHPMKESNVEALYQRNEDYGTKTPQTSDTEIADTALGQVYENEGRAKDDVKPTAEQTSHQEKEGLLSEMEDSKYFLQTLQSETNAPLDSQLQDNSVKADDQNDADFNPLRNKRKLGSSRRNKGPKHVKDSGAESHHKPTEEDVEDISSNETLETAMSSTLQTTSQEELSQENDHDVIMSVTYDTSLYTASTPDYSSEVHNPTTTNYPEADLESDDTKIPQTSDTERADTALAQCPHDNEERGEDDLKLTAEQTSLLSEMEDRESSLQTLQSETNAPLDSQPQDNSVKTDEQNEADFKPLRNRRKLGSSRRSKGQQHVKDSGVESQNKSTEVSAGNTMDNVPLETTKLSSTIETIQEISVEKVLEEEEKHDLSQSEEVSDKIKENAHVSTSTVDQSNLGEMPVEERPSAYSITESIERDEDTDLLKQWGILEANSLVNESHLKPDGTESSVTPEITTEKNSHREHTELECSVEQATVSSQKEELSANEEQNEHFGLFEVRRTEHSGDAVYEAHEEEEGKPTEMRKVHQIDYSSFKESKSSLQTLQSEIQLPLDSQTMDNSPSDKEEIRPGFKPTGNRRKLGSSRRNKGRQHAPDSVTEPYAELKEEVVENTQGDETSEREKITLTTETTRQEELKEQTDPGVKSAEKIISTVKEKENPQKLPEEDSALSQNIMDSSTIVTTDFTSSSEATVWKDDSDTQNISYHDGNDNTRSVASDVLDQKDALQALSRYEDLLGLEMSVQPTNYVKETVGDVMIKDYNTGAESSMYVQGPGQVEVREECKDHANKDHAAQEINTSDEVTHAALISDVSEERQISTAADACDSQPDVQETTPEDNSENLQGKHKQKRRKMASTRRTQLNRKEEGERDNNDETKESNLDMEADVRNADKMEVEQELPLIVTTDVSQKESAQPSPSTAHDETSSVHDKAQKLQSNASELQTMESNMIPGIDDSVVSHSEEAVNPVTFVHRADVRDSEGNIDVVVEPPESDDFSGTEMQTTSALTRRKRHTISQSQDTNTEGVSAQIAQNDEQSPEGITDGVNEGAHSTNAGMENPSPNFSSTNRRRKMGSTRRNLGSRSKREDLHQKQEEDDETPATNVGDVLTESVSGIEEKELQLHNEHEDSSSEQRKEKVFETVEYSHTGESQSKPPAHQTVDENPDSLSQLAETEHQLTPDYLPSKPSTSPKHDVSISESAAGGRRRKLGSHRKSHGPQNYKDQTASEGRKIDAQKGRDVRSLTDESAIKTTEEHKEESLSLDKISEVDESDKKLSSNISISEATEHSGPVGEKAPKRVTTVQYPHAEIQLGDSRGGDARSKTFNVVMVGDSCVGKTSFMKRAQSGKFSLDLPASVGLDSCIWTVVVEGKPVVLQLWDTAGQERFHSITRQIFHKAQAFLLMYDITSCQSFSAVSYWANCIQEGAADNMTILLLGNKSDSAKRQVKTQEGEILAKEYNFEFMECSAATGENVIESLETVARMLSQKADTREETVALHKEPPQKKTSGCC